MIIGSVDKTAETQVQLPHLTNSLFYASIINEIRIREARLMIFESLEDHIILPASFTLYRLKTLYHHSSSLSFLNRALLYLLNVSSYYIFAHGYHSNYNNK